MLTVTLNKIRRSLLRLTLICLRWIAPAALLLGPGGCAAQKVEVSLNPQVRLQVSNGWELNAEIADVEDGSDRALPRYQDALLDIVVDRVGINRVRLPVKSGSENTDRNWRRYAAREISYQAWRPLRYATVNDNADPKTIDWAGFDFSELDGRIEEIVVPMQRRLAARGERLFVNLCYVAFTDQLRGGAYHHDDPDEYAEFVLATYEHMQRRWGFTPDAWEVILEPDLVGRWDGRAIGERIVRAGRLLEANGFTPRFIAPSVENMSNGARFIDGIAAVPGAMAYVDEFSYHRYNGVSPAALDAISERARRYGKRTAMLEWWFGNATYEVLYEDLTRGLNSSWEGQSLIAVVDLDLKDPARPRLSLRTDSRLNAQYFRYIRLGAQRIGARSTDEEQVAPVAYVNPNGAYAVVLKARSGVGEIVVRGLPAGDYRIAYATERETVEPPEIHHLSAGQPLTASMPARGVVSIYDVRLPPKPVSKTR